MAVAALWLAAVSLLSAQIRTQTFLPVKDMPYRVKYADKPLQGNPMQLQETPVLKLTETRIFDNSSKAKVTLDVQMDWNDGSGYQLLLDADHSVCGTWVPDDRFIELLPSGEVADDFYREFEYKIPQDANGMFADENWIVAPDKESLEIDPGIYDYCVTNPTPGRFVYVASGADAVGDDIEFKAGVEYVFTLVRNGNFDLCTRTVVASVNMCVSEILLPDAESGLGEENLKVVLENQGTQPISGFPLQLYVDGVFVVEEQVDSEWASGEKKSYEFPQPVDLSLPGRHVVRVVVAAESDADSRNDTLEKAVYHIAPAALPYVSNFDSVADFERWSVVDANSDGTTWTWVSGKDADENSHGGFAQVSFSTVNKMDDYLVTRDPVILSEGLHNLSFRYASYSTSYKESLQVYYGKTADVTQMKLLWEAIDYPFEGTSWLFAAVEWEQEEAGEYYFAFHGCSKPEQWAIMLDKVKIDQGGFQGVPDLAVTEVKLPLSSCALGKSKVGAVVANKGTGDVSKVKLAYRIGEADPVEEEFECRLDAGSGQTFYFTEEADFSMVDSAYSVEVSCHLSASETGTEERIDNNAMTVGVVHYSPLEIPFNTDFSSEKDRSQWAASGRDWLYDKTTEAMAVQSVRPLLSRCVHLEEGSIYTFSMNYLAGDLLMDVIRLEENFDILYGIAGSDMAQWDTLKSFRGAYTDFAFVTDKVDFRVEADADYAFAFVPVTTNYTLRIKRVEIGMVADYDVAVVSMDAGFSAYTPLEQVSAVFPVRVGLRNAGTQPLDSIRVSVFHHEKEISSVICAIDSADKETEVRLGVAPDGLEAGDTLELTVHAVLVGKQDTTANNRMSVRTVLTDTVMAKDRVTDDMYVTTSSIGAKKPIGLGLEYRLNRPDTLTALSLGWAPASQDQDVHVAVYRWDADRPGLDDCIWSDTVRRGLEAGQRIYALEKALLLDSGDYLFEVRQLTEINFGLVVDLLPGGAFYVTTNEPISKQTNMGYPAYRLVFGHKGLLGEKDAAVKSIDAPEEEGLFGDREPVVVRVANLGHEQSRIPVRVWIDGVLLGETEVDAAPYATVETVFHADMSQEKTYRILAVCSLEGDSNPVNDTCRKEVRCMGAGNEAVREVSDIVLYPNPADSRVILKWKKESVLSVSISDMAGKQVREIRNLPSSDRIVVGLEDLHPGIYFVRIRTVGGDVVRKLVVR